MSDGNSIRPTTQCLSDRLEDLQIPLTDSGQTPEQEDDIDILINQLNHILSKLAGLYWGVTRSIFV